MPAKVLLKATAAAELAATPPAERKALLAAIAGLEGEPVPLSAERLAARPLFRLRVGPHRLLWSVDEESARAVVFGVRVDSPPS